MNKIKILLVTVLAYTSAVNNTNAQIVGQSNDTNYHNTTVVYVKPNTSGAEVLTSMESSTGLSDIIRIEAAPTAQRVVADILDTPEKEALPAEKPDNSTGIAQNQKVQMHVGMLNNIKPSWEGNTNMYFAHEKTINSNTALVKHKRTVAAKPSKKMKRQSTPPASRKIFRKKPGRQKYGCPKF